MCPNGRLSPGPGTLPGKDGPHGLGGCAAGTAAGTGAGVGHVERPRGLEVTGVPRQTLALGRGLLTVCKPWWVGALRDPGHTDSRTAKPHAHRGDSVWSLADPDPDLALGFDSGRPLRHEAWR